MKGLRIHKPKPLSIPSVEKVVLNNGLKLYFLEGGAQEVVKFEWCFKAGRSSEKSRLASVLCHSLIKEGCEGYSGFQIAEHFDYFGSSLNHQAGFDYCSFSFYCLNRFFDPLLDMFLKVISKPSFPENELSLLKSKHISRLRQERDDADFSAYKILTEKIFGTEHPYGYNSTEELVHHMHTDLLRLHFESNYLTSEDFVMITGRLMPGSKQELTDRLSAVKLHSPPENHTRLVEKSEAEKYLDNSFSKNQCAFKLGQRTIKRDHEDFPAFYIFSHLLGGFFNARLSRIIREQKGLTYNILSTHDTYVHDGIFYISAESSWKNLPELRNEVYRQLDNVLKKPPSKAELERVRAFLIGVLITSFDGVFATADTFRSCLVEEVDLISLQPLMDAIVKMSAEEVFERSHRHLDPARMIEVVTG